MSRGLFGDDVDMVKTMFGCEAVHVPMHMVVQDMGVKRGEHMVLFVGACLYGEVNPLMFGSKLGHVRVHGAIIVRPTGSVVETTRMRGNGLSGIATSRFFGGENEPGDKVLIEGGVRV